MRAYIPHFTLITDILEVDKFRGIYVIPAVCIELEFMRGPDGAHCCFVPSFDGCRSVEDMTVYDKENLLSQHFASTIVCMRGALLGTSLAYATSSR